MACRFDDAMLNVGVDSAGLDEMFNDLSGGVRKLTSNLRMMTLVLQLEPWDGHYCARLQLGHCGDVSLVLGRVERRTGSLEGSRNVVPVYT